MLPALTASLAVPGFYGLLTLVSGLAALGDPAYSLTAARAAW